MSSIVRGAVLKGVIDSEPAVPSPFPSVAVFGAQDPLDGVVLADYLFTVDSGILEGMELLGMVSGDTQTRIDLALIVALGLS
jgi:hypothetical protein